MSEMNRPAPIRSVSSTSRPSWERNGRGKKRILDMEEGSSSRKIRLNISGPDGAIVTYNVPVDLPMHIFLKKYCEHKTLEYMAMDFVYEGRRVQVRRTSEELHMVDGDQIDAFLHAPGG